MSQKRSLMDCSAGELRSVALLLKVKFWCPGINELFQGFWEMPHG
jgi:hypothetical protein